MYYKINALYICLNKYKLWNEREKMQKIVTPTTKTEKTGNKPFICLFIQILDKNGGKKNTAKSDLWKL
jgi:hypothetical protein